MIDNQTGGIISKVFIIPAGVVVIIAVFLVGYFVGKRQTAETASIDKPAALPEVLSQYVPDKAEFTFYKTLTDKGEKSVSIDLKTKPLPQDKTPEPAAAPKPAPERPPKAEPPPKPQKPAAQTVKKESAPASDPKVRYTIQVGSYEDRAMADEDVRSMKKMGYAAFVVSADIPDKGTWHRVRVGSFANKHSAEKLANEMKAKEGIVSFITTE